LTEDEAALKKENRLLVRRKVTDALGSLYGANLEQYRGVPVNEDFPPKPDAPRDTPTEKQVIGFTRWAVARCTAHCLTRTFATTN